MRHPNEIAEVQDVSVRSAARSTSIINPTSDFWLLGGASIALWVVLAIGQVFRYSSDSIDSHFLQIGAFFSLMTLFCNHPHFMISYRFGYGRGLKFILQNGFSLLLVPAGLIAFYTVAYLKFDTQFADSAWLRGLNGVFAATGIDFRIGTLANVGTECLSLSVWLMYLTVGWHYSKQVFGCMMVYARYDGYPLSAIQRRLIQLSLFSVAFFNFFYHAVKGRQYAPPDKFFNIPLVSIGLPRVLVPATGAVVALSLVLVCWIVYYKNYRESGKRPSANMLIAWIAFHVWWIPVLTLNEFYILAIPFFHSLQYLPFAYRLQRGEKGGSPTKAFKTTLGLAALLLIGFSAFEWIPSQLDRALETQWYLKTWFFMIAFAVFINVHHFFIDSVVWKFNQPDVRDRLFNE
jgi:hypothetical protein